MMSLFVKMLEVAFYVCVRYGFWVLFVRGILDM